MQLQKRHKLPVRTETQKKRQRQRVKLTDHETGHWKTGDSVK